MMFLTWISLIVVVYFIFTNTPGPARREDKQTNIPETTTPYRIYIPSLIVHLFLPDRHGKLRNNLLATAFLILMMVIPSYSYGESHMQMAANKTQASNNEKGQACSLSHSDLIAAKAYLRFRDIKATHIPKGVPNVYGPELNISFDNVQGAINRVREFGPTYGKNKIVLDGENLQRYVSIGSRIACEYCCSAKTLVQKDGSAACGCAHSIMMRGLAAYLIKSHPEFSDEQILGELNSWKKTFFPKQTLMVKLQKLNKEGKEGIDKILKEFPEFMPSMVGGC